MAMNEPEGRVIITWPGPAGQIVPGWGVIAYDADSGEQLLDVVALAITHGSPSSWDSGPLHVTLTRLVDGEGEPIGGFPNGHRMAYTDEYEACRHSVADDEQFQGQHFRTAEFRYLLAEMRVAPVHVESSPDGARALLANGADVATRLIAELGIPDQN